VTDQASVFAVGIKADDMVYNLSAKMLSPIQVRAKRHEFFFPVNYHGTVHIIEAMARAGRRPAGAFHHRHDLRPHRHLAHD
jgi:dTDP-glucose 4,6-dehydratase